MAHVCEHEEKIKDMSSKINEMHKLVCGNGKIGIAEQVRYNTWFRHIVYKLVGAGTICALVTAVGFLVKGWLS